MFVPGKYFTCVMVCLFCPFCSLFADNVQFSPDQIVLNAIGQQDDLLVIVRKPMPAGYSIAEFNVNLFLADTQISEAYALRYCTVDENYLVSFDWDLVVNSPQLTSFIGTIVTGSISGTVTLVNEAGDTFAETLSGTDEVEILDPQWQMSIFKSSQQPVDSSLLISMDTQPDESPIYYKWDRGQGTETYYGQTFRFSQPAKLDKVTLKLKTSGVDISGKVVVLYIGYGYHHVTDSRLAGIFFSPTAKLPSDLGLDQTWYLTFDFIDQYLLANRDYGFMLRFVSASPGQGGQGQELSAYVATISHYAYDDGAAFYYDGDCVKTLLNRELVFYLHGETLSQSPIIGDIDINYKVDMIDFALIANDWLDSVECGSGPDISCDSIVDLSDFELLAQNWLEHL